MPLTSDFKVSCTLKPKLGIIVRLQTCDHNLNAFGFSFTTKVSSCQITL
ncbi:MAG: hypothetical protein ACI9J2_001756 [Saprospiraceae bacterium]|jgi:hypothetical protein